MLRWSARHAFNVVLSGCAPPSTYAPPSPPTQAAAIAGVKKAASRRARPQRRRLRILNVEQGSPIHKRFKTCVKLWKEPELSSSMRMAGAPGFVYARESASLSQNGSQPQGREIAGPHRAANVARTRRRGDRMRRHEFHWACRQMRFREMRLNAVLLWCTRACTHKSGDAV
jgi:hypothetical protein